MHRVPVRLERVFLRLYVVSPLGIDFGRSAKRKRMNEHNAASGVALMAVI